MTMKVLPCAFFVLVTSSTRAFVPSMLKRSFRRYSLRRARSGDCASRKKFQDGFRTLLGSSGTIPTVGIRVTDLRRSEEHTSELQSRENLVCRLLLEKKKNTRENKQ